MERQNTDLKNDAVALFQAQNTPADVIALAESAERWVAAMAKIKAAVLKLTGTGDWVDEGGTPYLQASGAEKLAAAFGVKAKFIYSGNQPKVSEWKEPTTGGHYSYRIPMTVRIGNAEIDVVGKRSSNDPFFTTRYDFVNGRRRRIEVPPEEVDENAVIGSAISNGLANGISRLLGLRNLTWEELAKAGIYPERRVPYGKQQDAEEPTKETKETEEKASSAQIKAIYGLAHGAGYDGDSQVRELVAEILGREKPESLSQLSKRQASEVITRLQARARAKEEGQDD